MWIDSHAHLVDLSDTDLNPVLERARTHGVHAIVNTGTDLATSARAIEQAKQHSILRAAVGVSPFDVEQLPENWDKRLRTLASDEAVIAIGESGLDCSNPRYPSPQRQLPVLETQIQLAAALGLPLVVHSRGAETRVADIMKDLGARRVLFHCFTGDRDAARRILDEGHAISISGIVTFKKSPLRELLRYIPLSRLFIETDTPYLAPVPHRGHRNEPAWVSLVGEYVASVLEIPPERLAEQLTQNDRRLFVRNGPG
ncbi:MAG: YchF/TatD family DNA exonuclease [Chitinivibrionales bacterium]|nr:YchF/TatD family DNA exonuclease [Chitinivibrionales bacterium]